MREVGAAVNRTTTRSDGNQRGRRIEIKSGATRHVLLIGRWAIKVPRITRWRMFLHGLLANMQERQWSGFCHRLCPIVFGVPGGWLVVMRRAAPLPDETWDAWDASTMQQFKKFDGTTLPVEYKRDSLGEFEGRVVAVDYGS